MTVSMETVRMAKSWPRKNQSQRSDLPCHIIMVDICRAANLFIYYPTRQIVMFVGENFASIYLRSGMRDRSMGSGTKFAREIQLTDWSTAGNLSNRSSGVQIPRDICTRFGRYLYPTRCSWIIMVDICRAAKRRVKYLLLSPTLRWIIVLVYTTQAE